MLILSTAYLGNIQYYSKLIRTGEQVVIEQHENYQKQSFRTRCDILAANGVITLTIPVLKTSGEKTPIRDTRIDYSKAWQHQHWISIVSAYQGSPYFDFYRDDFEPFYQKRYDFLWDFNEALQRTVLGLLEIDPAIEYSDEYICPAEGDGDFRNALSPKPRLNLPDPDFRAEPYYQVFSEKYGFIPNLSIIDLIFCEGPGAVEIIRHSTLSGVR